MSIIDPNESIARGMLTAFTEDLKRRLVDVAIEAIRPSIEAEAAKAIKELQARVDAIDNPSRMTRDICVRLILEAKK